MAENSAERREEQPGAHRLTANISSATKAALDEIADREQINQTEALRRLVAYGRLLYRTAQIDGDEILIRRTDDSTLERIILI
ncbi:ribbon-helix-helix protein, CopG family [Actinokineospora sp. PR83]|uniref:ribbon-helix-helix protein, CopG family n=1 Tax=Actinokineospora sp. PR83 TaxID=2884908 RepID=UPI001F4788CD|nr:ribbon-helix-helix protein, CopG family [Actinokineospora sp. PR83]MCG8914892.1 ribbon-helix-helix protein, CopG family [Actinokineospora sp. PR83]